MLRFKWNLTRRGFFKPAPSEIPPQTGQETEDDWLYSEELNNRKISYMYFLLSLLIYVNAIHYNKSTILGSFRLDECHNTFSIQLLPCLTPLIVKKTINWLIHGNPRWREPNIYDIQYMVIIHNQTMVAICNLSLAFIKQIILNASMYEDRNLVITDHIIYKSDVIKRWRQPD